MNTTKKFALGLQLIAELGTYPIVFGIVRNNVTTNSTPKKVLVGVSAFMLATRLSSVAGYESAKMFSGTANALHRINEASKK